MKAYYDTLSEAVADLQQHGYTHDLNLSYDTLECKGLNLNMYPEQFNVDKMYRFEGASSPDDSSVLYAISSDQFNVKGLLVDAYGAYANELTTEIIQKLRYQP